MVAVVVVVVVVMMIDDGKIQRSKRLMALIGCILDQEAAARVRSIEDAGSRPHQLSRSIS